MRALFALLLVLPTVSHAAGKEVPVPAEAARLEPGSILIRAHERALYFIEDSEHALRFRVAVPKAGKEWTGSARVDGKYIRPAWSPPAEVKHDHPELPDVIAGGASNNPMGQAALTLDRDQIAIHGVSRTMDKSIGTAASYGCIRMHNEDIVELYSHVQVGAEVEMVP